MQLLLHCGDCGLHIEQNISLNDLTIIYIG